MAAKAKAKAKAGCFDLPEDVVFEILARLPVRSLLRFKCVCKSWYAHLQNPRFISKHLDCASSNDDRAHIALKYRNDYPKRLAFVSFLSNKAAAPIFEEDIVTPFLDDDDGDSYGSTNDMIFYGHCNGIICAIPRGNIYPTGDPIMLWNPATREIKCLYVPFLHHRDGVAAAHEYFLAVGFGFDTMSSDYKVVRIIDFARGRFQTRIFNPVVEVYNLSTDSWRKIEAELPKTIHFRNDSSTHLNGFYFWLANDANNGKFVLSFDFANEVFEKIPLPNINKSNKVSTLVKFNETIAVIAYKGVFDCIAVWVLNINRDIEKKTWTKLYKISSEWVRVVGFLKSGEALLIDGDHNYLGNKFTLYDPSTQQYNYLRVFNGSAYESFQMIDYVESLVSFKEDYELQK